MATATRATGVNRSSLSTRPVRREGAQPLRGHRPRRHLRCRPLWRGGAGPGRGRWAGGQHRRLRPGVAVPPTLPRTAGRVRVPPRGCAGVAAVLAHPHILPKAPGRPAHAGSRRVASPHAHLRGGWHRRRRAPPGEGAGRGGAPDHGLLPQRGAGRRPGCPHRRPGGRRCLRCRLPPPRRGRGAARGGREPVDQPRPIRQPAGGQARVRHDQPAPARGRGHARCRGPQRGRAPRSSPRASRSPTARGPVCAPRPIRCGPTPRGRSASSRDPSPPSSRPPSAATAWRASSCATAPSTDRAPTSRRTGSTPR